MSPIERARATIAVAEAGDAEAIHALVDLLEDADPAVRMFTIRALVRLSGEDYGYRYYRPGLERDAAVKRWRAALRDNAVVSRRRGRAADEAPDDRGGREGGARESGANEPGTGNAGSVRLDNRGKR